MAAGFISFPILTRIFSVSDYGILGLITTTLLIVTAITKLGFPESIVRFYAEFKSANRLSNFYSTLFLVSGVVGAIVAIIFILVTHFMNNNFLGRNTSNLLFLVSILIFISSMKLTLHSFLRAEQRTKLYNLISVIHRYGSLSLSIFLAFHFVKGLYGFYVGQIISGVIILIFLMYISLKRVKINMEGFSIDILKDSLKFGFPLIWAELGHLVLNYIDRYLIQLYLGSMSLGLYIAGYNLATYVTEVIIYPINYAMVPIYMSILANKGEEETRIFFTKSFRYFILIMFPVTFGFIAVSKDLITFLASTKYAESYNILAYVAIGQAIYACTLILNNGLFIRKKTYLYKDIMIITCLLNIGLNIILIPMFGIIGAAQATLISYIFYTIVITYYAFKEFRFPIDYAHIMLYLFAAATMYLVMKSIDNGTPFVNLLTRIPAGAIFYAILIMALDRDIRNAAFRMIARPSKV